MIPELEENGEPCRDNNRKIIYKRKSKVLITADGLHALICKPKSEGGYEGARDTDGNIIFSVNTIIHYWPNWLKIMSDADMIMCGCDTCLGSEDMHAAYKAKRSKILSAAEVVLEEMDDGPTKLSLRVHTSYIVVRSWI